MSFRVAARTLVHLGAELITSDAIALYELIKNAFDARSPKVEIRVRVTLGHSKYRELRAQLLTDLDVGTDDHESNTNRLRLEKDRIFSELEPTAPQDARAAFSAYIEAPRNLRALIEALDNAYRDGECNRILIRDWGHGMSLEELEDVYLTIGTPSRLDTKADRRKRIRNGEIVEDMDAILGDKGIGRLSAMRIGDLLEVRTSRQGERNWHLLTIDWTLFSDAPGRFLEDIEISPREGVSKQTLNDHRTTLRITRLRADWDKAKLLAIVRQEFSRLTDPFSGRRRYPIGLYFNDEVVPIPPIDRAVLDAAHAKGTATFEIDERGEPVLYGHFNYRMRRREKAFRLVGIDVASIVKPHSFAALRRLGPFSMEFYWYNRRVLKSLPGIMDLRALRDRIKDWGGGLMLFRDGFRVPPYGTGDDDWLQLDQIAFASKAYRMNRSQIIGRVNIGAENNPYLVDKANREGLVDSPEKAVMVALLRHVLIAGFKPFAEIVEQEAKADEARLEDLSALEHRLDERKALAQADIRIIRPKLTDHRDQQTLDRVLELFKEIDAYVKRAKSVVAAFESDQSKFLHLAGLGLMVEIVSHDLNQSTAHVLTTLNDADIRDLPGQWRPIFDILKAQLKTLEKRLRILDPMSTASRQIPETFDLTELVKEIVDYHEGQFGRHKIRAKIEPEGVKAQQIKAVKGMMIQVLENLIANSVYWIKEQAKIQPRFRPEIRIEIDATARELRLTDNGPGIDPARREEIFDPFVTTKPPGQGKGLGLYISREIARYHGANLFLSAEPSIHEGRLNTFVYAIDGS